jgi:hypothetical protein
MNLTEDRARALGRLPLRDRIKNAAQSPWPDFFLDPSSFALSVRNRLDRRGHCRHKANAPQMRHSQKLDTSANSGHVDPAKSRSASR